MPASTLAICMPHAQDWYRTWCKTCDYGFGVMLSKMPAARVSDPHAGPPLWALMGCMTVPLECWQRGGDAERSRGAASASMSKRS
jgi:hypothetical protein